MNGKARMGRCILVAIIVVIALAEIALAVVTIQTEQFKGKQIVRVLLTGWLLWQAWDGARWARWVLAALSLATAILAATFVLVSPYVEGKPEVLGVLIGLSGVSALFAVGLASPWVGAYQAACRGRLDTETRTLPQHDREDDKGGAGDHQARPRDLGSSQ